uniref:Uncharacterized protein n=1 Tax=Ditylenchus dipsaci TaxID=166011 RepID=A0A915EFW6_9BILA
MEVPEEEVVGAIQAMNKAHEHIIQIDQPKSEKDEDEPDCYFDISSRGSKRNGEKTRQYLMAQLYHDFPEQISRSLLKRLGFKFDSNYERTKSGMGLSLAQQRIKNYITEAVKCR